MSEKGASQLGRPIGSLLAILGLVVFYAAIYLPDGANFVDGDRRRLGVGLVGLIVTGVGLGVRQTTSRR